jgi:hypothetical protein
MVIIIMPCYSKKCIGKQIIQIVLAGTLQLTMRSYPTAGAVKKTIRLTIFKDPAERFSPRT